MKKEDIPKVLEHTLWTYIFFLCIIFAIKIMGFNYFGIDTNNFIFNFINNTIYLKYIIQIISLYFQSFFLISLITEKKNIKKFCLLITIVCTFSQIIMTYFNIFNLYSIFNVILLIISVYIVNNKTNIKRLFFIFIINIIFQSMSLIVKNNNVFIEINALNSLILNIDYFLMLFIFYKINIEGGVKCLTHGFSLDRLIKLKAFPKQLLNQFQNKKLEFSKLTKEDKISTCIFIPLALLYNIFTLLVILFIATLNHTVIECIFITSAFMINKSVFGKPFHFSSMLTCFTVSNLVYYTLNRITTPIGISILVPIALGVILSHVASSFVKNKIYKLYKGMPLNVFDETILKVTDKDSIDYQICKYFYIDGWSEIKIAMKVSYSKPSIQIKKKNINKKLLELK